MISKAEYDAAMREKDGQINALRHQLEQLKRLIFSSTSEKFRPAESPAEQLDLGFSDSQSSPENDEQQGVEKITYTRKKKKHHGRNQLPENLPVRQVTIEPEEDTQHLVKIGEEITRKVDYIPGKLEIIEYIRPKYARPPAEQLEGVSPIVIADVPEQVLPKSIITVNVLVQIIVAKYIDHLPFYRQRAMFKREFEWQISKSTINYWFTSGCALLEPLYPLLQQDVLDTDYLQGDESRIKVLIWMEKDPKKPDKKNTHLGYMWVFRNPQTGNVFFAYRKGRGTNVLNETLEDFTGLLQSDGYSAYTSFMKKHPKVELVSCLAHIRRKFFDAQKNLRELAELALRAIQYLYRIERICRNYGCSPEVRQRMRQRYARPAYEGLL